MGKEAISEGMRPWATAGATGGLHAGLLSVSVSPIDPEVAMGQQGLSLGRKGEHEQEYG